MKLLYNGDSKYSKLNCKIKTWDTRKLPVTHLEYPNKNWQVFGLQVVARFKGYHSVCVFGREEGSVSTRFCYHILPTTNCNRF